MTSVRGRGAALLVLVAAAWWAPAGAAQGAATDTARLGGTFAMSGTITVARHVRGERAGQHVARAWSFTPLCSTGQCPRVSLVRQRAGGTDHLVLSRTGPGQYAGSGRFYAPVRCGGRTIRNGESVPFTIKVTITAAAATPGGLVASALQASYVNPSRSNLTRCVAVPGRDAAVYDGQPAPAAS